jgi:hypothetical protein
MPDREWLDVPHGTRDVVDSNRGRPDRPADEARSGGGRMRDEPWADAARPPEGTKVARAPGVAASCYEPPLSAIGPLFLRRLERIHPPRVDFVLDINPRATARVLGGYYRRRRLIRIYTHDRESGRRSLEELFDTFLHEVAHHLEYTEPQRFNARACERVPGTMHSDLFWRILGELKSRWADLQERSAGAI